MGRRKEWWVGWKRREGGEEAETVVVGWWIWSRFWISSSSRWFERFERYCRNLSTISMKSESDPQNSELSQPLAIWGGVGVGGGGVVV